MKLIKTELKLAWVGTPEDKVAHAPMISGCGLHSAVHAAVHWRVATETIATVSAAANEKTMLVEAVGVASLRLDVCVAEGVVTTTPCCPR